VATGGSRVLSRALAPRPSSWIVSSSSFSSSSLSVEMPFLSALLSSLKSISPDLSASHFSKSSSMSLLVAPIPVPFTALRNSFLVSTPLRSSSHSLKRSTTRTAFFLIERLPRNGIEPQPFS
jgi:hypothetical protein